MVSYSYTYWPSVTQTELQLLVHILTHSCNNWAIVEHNEPQFQSISCSYTYSVTVTESKDWPTVIHAEPQLVTVTESVTQTELLLHIELKLLIVTKFEPQLQIEDYSYTSYDKVTWNKLQLHSEQHSHWPRYTYTEWATVTTLSYIYTNPATHGYTD